MYAYVNQLFLRSDAAANQRSSIAVCSPSIDGLRSGGFEEDDGAGIDGTALGDFVGVAAAAVDDDIDAAAVVGL